MQDFTKNQNEKSVMKSEILIVFLITNSDVVI